MKKASDNAKWRCEHPAESCSEARDCSDECFDEKHGAGPAYGNGKDSTVSAFLVCVYGDSRRHSSVSKKRKFR